MPISLLIWFGVQIPVVGWGVVRWCFLSIWRCWTGEWKGTPFPFLVQISHAFWKKNHIKISNKCDFCLQAVKETGHKFRETILALGGGKAPLEVRLLNIFSCENWTCRQQDSCGLLSTKHLCFLLILVALSTQVFVAFRGREPSPEALLRHNGLLSGAASAWILHKTQSKHTTYTVICSDEIDTSNHPTTNSPLPSVPSLENLKWRKCNSFT